MSRPIIPFLKSIFNSHIQSFYKGISPKGFRATLLYFTSAVPTMKQTNKKQSKMRIWKNIPCHTEGVVMGKTEMRPEKCVCWGCVTCLHAASLQANGNEYVSH